MAVAAKLLLSALVAVSGTNEVGLKFLEENKHKEGVVVLPSGLQYKVLRHGNGDGRPQPEWISRRDARQHLPRASSQQ